MHEACTADADDDDDDDDLSEPDVAELVKCIRLCLDCADTCTTTVSVTSRQTDYDPNVAKPGAVASGASRPGQGAAQQGGVPELAG